MSATDDKKQKRPVGCPPTITPEWAEEKAKILTELFQNGESVAEVCAILGICKDSYYKAIRICNNFADADKKGKELSEAWWTRLGRQGATGAIPIQPATWIFNMKNRFGWRENSNVNIGGQRDNPIKVIASEIDPQEAAEIYRDMMETEH